MAAADSSRTGDDHHEGSVADDELHHRRLQAAEDVVQRWESRGAEAGGGALDSPELVAAARELVSLSSDGGANAQRAKAALQRALGHLEDEFHQVLSSGTYFQPADNLLASRHDSIILPGRSSSFSSLPGRGISSFVATSDDSRTTCTGFSSGSSSIEKLHLYLIDPISSIMLKEIAEVIILAGHDPTSLCNVYSETRHDALMQCLLLLGVQIEPKIHNPEPAITEDGFNMQLDCRRVQLWIQGLKFVVGTVLPEERHACTEIFGFDNMAEQYCFARATTRCTQHLLTVGSAIAKTKDQNYEVVSLLLQMHEQLAKVQPNLQGMFASDTKDTISQEVTMLLDKLRDAAVCLLLEFLKLQPNCELDEMNALDGSILSLTQYVMGFIKVLSEYRDSLDLILPQEGIERTKSPWECYILKLLSQLQLNIMEKSKSYIDERLRYIFLMNNAMHVLESSNSSVLRVPLKEDRIHQQLVLQVEQYATSYFRSSWSSPLFHLKDIEFHRGKVSTSVKEGLKNFNSAFREIIRAQTTWKVPDPQLRQHLRIVILHHVIPVYLSYLGRFVSHCGSDVRKHVKYSVEDIENHVLDLFEG